jgi:hypothetical protein
MTQPVQTASTVQKSKPKTFLDITKEIVVKAGIQGVDIAGIHKAVWFQGPWTSTEEGTDIRHGGPFPLNPGLNVFRIFEDEDELRVYCLQGADANGKPKGEEIPPSCYRLNKRARTYTASAMTLLLWEDEIAREFRMQAVGLPDDTTCDKCGTNVPDMPFCGQCGQKLPENVEDDEEEDPEEPGLAVVKPATNGATAVESP